MNSSEERGADRDSPVEETETARVLEGISESFRSAEFERVFLGDEENVL